MSFFRKTLPIPAILLFMVTTSGLAQTYDEVMKTYWNVFGFGASSFTLLNNSQLATDISSTQSNPAFFTNIKRPKAVISGQGISVHKQSTLESYSDLVNQKYSTSVNEYNIDYIGFAYPVPVYQGSLVLAASYSPAAYYYSSVLSKGSTVATYGAYNIDTDLEYDTRESGSINIFKLAGATEFMKNFNIGMSLNFYSGERSYQSSETDYDPDDNMIYNSLVYTEDIRPGYSGFNIDFGMCYQSEKYKAGLRISTPLNLSIHEVSELSEDYIYNTVDTLNVYSYDFEYKSCYPLEIAPNFAIKIANISLGMDLIFHNWKKIEVDLLEDKSDINHDLYWNLKNTTDIGATVAIPFGNSISTRFAYRLVESPYENVADDESYYHVLGAGVETILNKSVIVGCSYQRGFGNLSNFYPYFETTTYQKYTEDRLSLSLAVLF